MEQSSQDNEFTSELNNILNDRLKEHSGTILDSSQVVVIPNKNSPKHKGLQKSTVDKTNKPEKAPHSPSKDTHNEVKNNQYSQDTTETKQNKYYGCPDCGTFPAFNLAKKLFTCVNNHTYSLEAAAEDTLQALTRRKIDATFNTHCPEHKEKYILFCEEHRKHCCIDCENRHKNCGRIHHLLDMKPSDDEIARLSERIEKKKIELSKSGGDFSRLLKSIHGIVNSFSFGLMYTYDLYQTMIQTYRDLRYNYFLIHNVNQIISQKELAHNFSEGNLLDLKTSLKKCINSFFQEEINSITIKVIVRDEDEDDDDDDETVEDEDIDEVDVIREINKLKGNLEENIQHNTKGSKDNTSKKDLESEGEKNKNYFKDENSKNQNESASNNSQTRNKKNINKPNTSSYNTSKMSNQENPVPKNKQKKNYETKKTKNINEDIYILSDKANNKHQYDFNELNKDNCIMTVDGVETPFKKAVKFSTIGEHTIQLFLKTKLTTMRAMFYNCKYITFIDLSNLDTSEVTNCKIAFGYCSELEKIKGLKYFNSKKVNKMSLMFNHCESLREVDVSSFDTINVNSMRSMFQCCYVLKKIIGLNNFRTQNVKEFNYMFNQCFSIHEIDIKNFIFNSAKTMEYMFANCEGLWGLIINGTFNDECVMKNLFAGKHIYAGEIKVKDGDEKKRIEVPKYWQKIMIK